MHTVAVALEAMATRFEIVLHGPDPVALRAAGEAALAEVQRLEARLSLFRPDSEIARVNARAAREPVRVTPEVFALLERARQLSVETAGAFDITVGPLMRCWKFWSARGHQPAPAALAAARQCVGMQQVECNPRDFTIRFARPGVMLDLGAIGKGYALEQAAGLLREAGVGSALLHGGTSTVYGLGHPPDAPGWKVAIDRPAPDGRASSTTRLSTVTLRDEALSLSAVWGKWFQTEGRVFGHVMDPRTGRPTDAALLAAVATASATESDALATALLALGPAGVRQTARLRPNLRALVVARAGDDFQVTAEGFETA